MSNEKKVLLDLGNVIIKESDRLNVEVFRLETYKNMKTKEVKTDFRFAGYSRNIISALEKIYRERLLINDDKIQELSDVIEQINNSDEIIKNAIRELEEN